MWPCRWMGRLRSMGGRSKAFHHRGTHETHGKSKLGGMVSGDWAGLPANIAEDGSSKIDWSDERAKWESCGRADCTNPSARGVGDHYGHERLGQTFRAQGVRGSGLLLCRQFAGGIDSAVCGVGGAVFGD